MDILCIQYETAFNLSLRTNLINNEICIYYLADCTLVKDFNIRILRTYMCLQ